MKRVFSRIGRWGNQPCSYAWRESRGTFSISCPQERTSAGQIQVGFWTSWNLRYRHSPAVLQQQPTVGIRTFGALTVGPARGGQQRYDHEIGKQLNNTIATCGRNGDWRKIVELHQRYDQIFNPVNYSTAMNQLAKIKDVHTKNLGLQSLMRDITLHLENNPSKWSIRTKVMVLHSIAKMKLDGCYAKKAMDLILQNAVAIVEVGNPISVSLTAWSVATMNQDCPKLFTAIEHHASHLVKNGTPQSVSNTIWAFATKSIDCPQFLKCIDQNAVDLVRHGNPQTMSNTLWSCAKLGVSCPTFFQAVEDNADRLLHDESIRPIVLSLWSVATLGIDCPRLTWVGDERAKDIVTHGSPQQIANTAWSFAKMGIECPTLFQAINRNPSCVITKKDQQAIANTAWAFATLKVTATNYFRAIEDQGNHIIQSNTAPHISMVLWSFASQGIQAPTLCMEIENMATSIVSKGDSRSISSILWSFATLGVACPNLCHAIDLNANRLIQNGSSQSLANMLWSMSLLGYNALNLYKAVQDPMVDDYIQTCNNQEIVNICYSFAISGNFKPHPHSFMKVWERALQIDWSQLTNEGRIQMIQTYLFVSNVYSMKLRPPSFTLDEELTVDVRNSLAEQEMSDILRQDLGFPNEREVSPFTSNENVDLWMIDCACRERKIAFEFDGPFHYLRRAGSRRLPTIENGPTKAKRRFLQSLGWTVVTISYLEWTDAKTRDGKRRLLAAKLESINA